MYRIAFTGPESTWKTSLSQEIAKSFKGHFVPEFARLYLTQKKGKYTIDDLLIMARKQFDLIHELPNSSLLVADTELLVIKIWSQYKYATCAPEIEELLQKQAIDHYFLCDIDVPWEYDPLRENPHDRKKLLKMYIEELKRLNAPYTLLNGSYDNKIKQVKEVLSLSGKIK